MNVGDLIRMLERYPRDAEVELGTRDCMHMTHEACIGVKVLVEDEFVALVYR